jgi:hypothetical protein
MRNTKQKRQGCPNGKKSNGLYPLPPQTFNGYYNHHHHHLPFHIPTFLLFHPIFLFLIILFIFVFLFSFSFPPSYHFPFSYFFFSYTFSSFKSPALSAYHCDSWLKLSGVTGYPDRFIFVVFPSYSRPFPSPMLHTLSSP